MLVLKLKMLSFFVTNSFKSSFLTNVNFDLILFEKNIDFIGKIVLC